MKPPPLPAGNGSFSLTLSGAGRTVLPTTPELSDFVVYNLDFTPVNGGAAANVDRGNAALATEPVLLEPGTYTLAVNAYKDANKTQLAARGTLDGIVITAGKNTSALVTLEALLSGGTGTFRWAITLPAGVSAAMTIAPESAGGTNQQTVTLTAPQAAGSCTLNSGRYSLTFTLEKTGERPVEWRELLYVYQSLESVFSFTFTNAYFTDPAYTVTFNSNGGVPATWGQSVLHGGTVERPADPTKRGYAFNGWYTDNNSFANAWDFDTPVFESFTLYAEWEPVNAVPGATLAAKLAWLQDNAISDVDYIVEVSADENIGPHTLSYSGRSNIGIILNGMGAERIIGLSSNGSLFTVPSGVTLVLDENITLQGRSDNNASLVRVNAGGMLVMNEGSVVTGNTCTSSSYGGGVYVTGSNAAFTMNGGNITGNTANYYGGGVYVTSSAAFTMNGGEISGNNTPSSTTYGGGVYATGSNTAFTMAGGEITGNTATYGGGVYVTSSAAFTMSGGEISGNNTPSASGYGGYGGGVYVTSSAAFTMSDGTISGNTSSGAGNCGGGVYVTTNGTFTMSGGEISGNTASVSSFSFATGGGVYVINGTFTKTGGGTIYGYNASDTVNSNAVKDSSGNAASNRGHAVYAYANNITKRKETTAGPGMNLSWNGTVNPPTRSGEWDNYMVIYSVNGGNGTTPSAGNVNAGSGVSLPSGSGLTMPGHAFGGWNTEADGMGENYNAGSTYTPDGDITLYAKWDILAYTVTFDINGGTGAAPAQATNTGSGVILPGGSGFSKEGYIFGDWNANAGGTGTTYYAGSNYTPAPPGGAITLYARWVTPPVVDMVWVGGGSFDMGKELGTAATGDVTPVHTVTLTTGFYMGKYEVTQAQYQTVMGTNPSDFKGSADSPNRPVETVSWYDAVVFCNKLSMMTGLTPAYRISNSTNPDDWGSVPTSSNSTWNAVTIESGSTGYRLPTEAQWEYAAKGGDPLADGWVGYTYAGSDDPDAVAWYSGNNVPIRTKTVGTKAPNSLGLYDMSGNVYEWCWDWYGSYSSAAQSDPEGASSGSGRVLRGGHWYSSAGGVRSAYRYYNDPSLRSLNVGFRLVRP